MNAIYSYCESVYATSFSPWHIRKLTAVGKKLGGGIDTKSLCGKVERGWDLQVDINPAQHKGICKECLEIYKSGIGGKR